MPAKPKPRITIVGAGNLAHALAAQLHRGGYAIDQIVARGPKSSLARARSLARAVGATATVAARARLRTEVIWLCVPDRAIAEAAESLAHAADWKGRVALHSSGALTSDELAVLREKGAAVASVHPLMTFVHGSHASLAQVPFAVEGDTRAARSARAIIKDLKGRAFSIRKEKKAAYHAWGMFASPLLCALLAATERVALAAGVKREAARERMLPILRQTLANYARLGAPASFSGPVVRGDVATVQKHLKVLRGVPGAREVYMALARAALHDLPAKKRGAMKRILRDAKNF